MAYVDVNTMTPDALEAYCVAERAKRERRDARRRVGKLPLTKSQRDILMALVNLWFAHRYKSGSIHPGRDLLAKKSKVKSVKTVSRALSLFCDKGWIEAVAYQKGGTGKATHYRVKLEAIQEASEPCTVQSAPGILIPFRPRQTGTQEAQNVPVSAGQNVPLSKDKHSNVFSGPGSDADWSEVPF